MRVFHQTDRENIFRHTTVILMESEIDPNVRNDGNQKHLLFLTIVRW